MDVHQRQSFERLSAVDTTESYQRVDTSFVLKMCQRFSHMEIDMEYVKLPLKPSNSPERLGLSVKDLSSKSHTQSLFGGPADQQAP